MIIQNSQIALAGSSSYKKTVSEEAIVSRSVTRDGQMLDFETKETRRDEVELSQTKGFHASEMRMLLEETGTRDLNKAPSPAQMQETAGQTITTEAAPKDSLKALMAKAETSIRMLNELLSRFVQNRGALCRSNWGARLTEQIKSFNGTQGGFMMVLPGGSKVAQMAQMAAGPTITRLTGYQSKTVEIENSMQFQASAQVNTADGRAINMDIMLNMRQSFYESHREKIDAVFQDPLVINLRASSAQLSQAKFEFDLDCDGTPDQISRLLGGSGYLALDKNEDGTINDGSELFGAQNGDGFVELAKYDQDGNGWIDEADDIFNQLRIWQHHEDGTTGLISLGQSGVGAIYLGSVETNYLLGDFQNQDGMIRKSGFFLFEDGSGGTVQHVDLAI